MNLELLIKMLMKMLGINDQQVREAVSKAQDMALDAKRKVDNIDYRLARIEKALGIACADTDAPEAPATELRIDNGGPETHNQQRAG